MSLSWSDQERIAEALYVAFPDVDRLSLTHEQLRVMVTSLPDFDGGPQPPGPQWLDKILWTWMRLAHGDADSGFATAGREG